MPGGLTQVGVITSPHGVRGWVKIYPLTGDADDLFIPPFLSDDAGARHFTLTRKGRQKELVIVAVEGVTDRNAAELLRGTALFSSAVAGLNENQWRYTALTGLEARLAGGKPYGRVTGVYNFGAGDIIELELHGGKTEMLPFNGDFIGEVRPEDGYLIVIPPEYMEAGSEE